MGELSVRLWTVWSPCLLRSGMPIHSRINGSGNRHLGSSILDPSLFKHGSSAMNRGPSPAAEDKGLLCKQLESIRVDELWCQQTNKYSLSLTLSVSCWLRCLRVKSICEQLANDLHCNITAGYRLGSTSRSKSLCLQYVRQCFNLRAQLSQWTTDHKKLKGRMSKTCIPIKILKH